MVGSILRGCPYLLYLNLSSTCITNNTLKELFRWVLKHSPSELLFWHPPVQPRNVCMFVVPPTPQNHYFSTFNKQMSQRWLGFPLRRQFVI